MDVEAAPARLRGLPSWLLGQAALIGAMQTEGWLERTPDRGAAAVQQATEIEAYRQAAVVCPTSMRWP
jgi:hypothetical protein